jgi:hypothetical protein
MIISVLQDSTETALNSSTDVLFTAAVDIRSKHIPTATTCIATSDEIPNKLQATGIRSKEPPATPEQ